MNTTDTRRQRLLDVLLGVRGRLGCWKGPSPRTWDGWMVELQEAEGLLRESCVTLAIAGAEGAGKSTLLNAILGQDVVMREDFEPGTVAPVLVRFAPSEEFSYQVVPRGSRVPIECADVEQFSRFILQRHNEHNHMEVECGVVTYADELLADGLTLLDLPGVYGVSNAVDEQTRERLAECHAVVLTVKEREWAPAREALRALPDPSCVKAVVVNCSNDFFGRADAAEQAARLRKAVHSQLGLTRTALSSTNVFVLHAPSMSRCEPREDGLVQDTLHRTEVGRFREWFTRRLDHRRVDGLLGRTASHLQRVCSELAIDVGARLREVQRAANGDSRARTRMIQRVDRQSEQLDREWDQVLANPAWTERKELAWGHLRRQVDSLRSAALDALAHARAAIGPESRWTLMTSDAINALMREHLREPLEAFDKAATDAMLTAMSWLRIEAEELQLRSFARAPVAPGPLPPIHLKGEGLIELSEPSTMPSLVELLMGRLTKRVLADWSSKITALSGSKSGPQWRAFDRNVDRAITAFREAMSNRLQERRECLERDPSHDGLSDSIEALSELESFLERAIEECHAFL